MRSLRLRVMPPIGGLGSGVGVSGAGVSEAVVVGSSGMSQWSAGPLDATIGNDPETDSGSFRIAIGDGWREHRLTSRHTWFRPPTDSAPLSRSVDNRVVAGVASG